MLRACRVPACLVSGTLICAAHVMVDSASARAVVSSLTEAKLKRKKGASTQSCADALLAAAHNKTPDTAFFNSSSRRSSHEPRSAARRAFSNG
jgi:hypothetical protein